MKSIIFTSDKTVFLLFCGQLLEQKTGEARACCCRMSISLREFSEPMRSACTRFFSVARMFSSFYGIIEKGSFAQFNDLKGLELCFSSDLLFWERCLRETISDAYEVSPGRTEKAELRGDRKHSMRSFPFVGIVDPDESSARK